MNLDLLRSAEYEVRHPRPSVVEAIESLDLTAGMDVLDAGCGCGAHLPLFARHVGPAGMVAGVDIDEERLVVAAEICADFLREGWIHVQVADINNLPFSHGAFDVAWSSLVLHHFGGADHSLMELMRVTKPGGIVAVLEGDHAGSFPMMPWPPAFEHRLREAVLHGEQASHDGSIPDVSAGYIARSLPRLLHATGLSDVRICAFADVFHAPLDQEREDNISRWLLSWFDRRARDWLDPVEWEQLVAYLDPASRDYLLSGADFFVSRTWFLAVGRVPVDGGRA